MSMLSWHIFTVVSVYLQASTL